MVWQDGIWLSPVGSRDCWVIGDKPHDKQPDYPGKNSGQFLVKIWDTSDVKKYVEGNYPAKNRVDKNEWEYVRVTLGQLNCKIGETTAYTFEGKYPGQGCDIPPEQLRAWYLPLGATSAAGIAIFRQRDRTPIEAGQGEGYELVFWDLDKNQENSEAALVKRLAKPINLAIWQWLLLIPFGGGVWLTKTQSSDTIHFAYGQHAFVPAGQKEWHLQFSCRTHGVAIFF